MKHLIASLILPILVALVLSIASCAAASAASRPPKSGVAHPPTAKPGELFDCSADYGGRAASCERVPCSKKYQSFLGTWQGEFHAYVRSKSTAGKAVYRPYRNSVRYSPSDCLENPKAEESFIVGRQTDRYPAFEGLPAKVERSLLIIGRDGVGKPFLRTVKKRTVHRFALTCRNAAASLSIWTLRMPAANGKPALTFTTIDGRDFSAPAKQARNVTVTLAVGPASAPYWQGVIVYGSHAKQL